MNAAELHKTAVVVDAHQEILDAYVYEFLLHEEQAICGELCVFDRIYKPLLEKQGVNLIHMAVGGDHVRPELFHETE